MQGMDGVWGTRWLMEDMGAKPAMWSWVVTRAPCDEPGPGWPPSESGLQLPEGAQVWPARFDPSINGFIVQPEWSGSASSG